MQLAETSGGRGDGGDRGEVGDGVGGVKVGGDGGAVGVNSKGKRGLGGDRQQGLAGVVGKPVAPLPCPRCESLNTKFCYYNNYSVTQPRHFCRQCQRYWTAGGTLRNVPVGGGSRKKSRHARGAPEPFPATSSFMGNVTAATALSSIPPGQPGSNIFPTMGFSQHLMPNMAGTFTFTGHPPADLVNAASYSMATLTMPVQTRPAGGESTSHPNLIITPNDPNSHDHPTSTTTPRKLESSVENNALHVVDHVKITKNGSSPPHGSASTIEEEGSTPMNRYSTSGYVDQEGDAVSSMWHEMHDMDNVLTFQ